MENGKRYSLKKSLAEAGDITKLVGYVGAHSDYETAHQIVNETKEELAKKRKIVCESLREGLKLLISKSVLVINLERTNQDEDETSPDEQADILIDAMPEDIDRVREYLGSEKNLAVVKEKQGSRKGYFFYLKLKS